MSPDFSGRFRAPANAARPTSPSTAIPTPGVRVYQSSLYSGQGSWEVVGGTSLGAPAWAAIIAIADQGRCAGRQASARRRNADSAHALHRAIERLQRDSTARHPGPAWRSPPARIRIPGEARPNGPPLVADLVASNISSALTHQQSPDSRKNTVTAVCREKASGGDRHACHTSLSRTWKSHLAGSSSSE